MPRKESGSFSKDRDGRKTKESGKGSKGIGGYESCPGYIDEYGFFNTGFNCPRWGTLEDEYCCGTQHEKYCCEEPDPIIQPDTSHHIPLIAGAAASVLLIAVIIISCFLCPCCFGAKFLKRTRRTKNSKAKNLTQHCNGAVNSENSPGTLACGCPIGLPPGSHSHQMHHMGSQADPDDFQQDVDMVLTLYENPTAHWENADLEDIQYHTPSDKPPPYSENMLVSENDPNKIININPTTEDSEMLHKLTPSHMFCMKTFQPHEKNVAPMHSAMTESRFHNEYPAAAMQQNTHLLEQSRRDSGVLVEEQESLHGGTGSSNGTQEEGEEQDNYNESIVVPKFNFQSLNLVNKCSANKSINSPLHYNLLSGSTSSGLISHNRTIPQVESLYNRSATQSRNSLDAIEQCHDVVVPHNNYSSIRPL